MFDTRSLRAIALLGLSHAAALTGNRSEEPHLIPSPSPNAPVPEGKIKGTVHSFHPSIGRVGINLSRSDLDKFRDLATYDRPVTITFNP